MKDKDRATPANPASPPAWAVWRMGDDGNRFLVRQGLALADAERLVAEFTARGHKQLYWVERDMAERTNG